VGDGERVDSGGQRAVRERPGRGEDALGDHRCAVRFLRSADARDEGDSAKEVRGGSADLRGERRSRAAAEVVVEGRETPALVLPARRDALEVGGHVPHPDVGRHLTRRGRAVGGVQGRAAVDSDLDGAVVEDRVGGAGRARRAERGERGGTGENGGEERCARAILHDRAPCRQPAVLPAVRIPSGGVQVVSSASPRA